MNVYQRASYPAHVLKQVLSAFGSPDLPKRPDGIPEPASVVFGNDDGFHTVYIFEVNDAQVGPLLSNVMDRVTFIGSRVEGFRSEVFVGRSLMEAVGTAQKLI